MTEMPSGSMRPFTEAVAVEGFMTSLGGDGMVCVVPPGDIMDSPGLTEINGQLADTEQSSIVHQAIHAQTPMEDGQIVTVPLDQAEANWLGVPPFIIVQADGKVTPVFMLVTKALAMADQADVQHLIMPIYLQRPTPIARTTAERTRVTDVLEEMATAIDTYRRDPQLGRIRMVTVVLAPHSVINPVALCEWFEQRLDPNKRQR